MKRLAFIASAVVLSACSTAVQQGEEANATEVKDINLQVAGKDKLPADVAAKLSGYHFVFEPAGSTQAYSNPPTCTERVDVSKAWADGKSLVVSAKAKRGCVYTLKLELGTLDSSAKIPALSKIYYFGDKIVDTNAVAADKKSIDIDLELKLNPAVAGELTTPPPVIIASSSDLDVNVNAKIPQPSTGTQGSISTGNGIP